MRKIKIGFPFKSMPFWISVWFVSVIYYALSLTYNFHVNEADYVAYIVQTIADLFMAVFSTKAYLKIKSHQSKKFYLLILISIFPGLISTETYNVLVNLVKIKHVHLIMNQAWIFPYSFFLFVQIAAWSYLLFVNKKKINIKHDTWITKFPYIQSGMIASLSIFIIFTFKLVFFKNMGLIQILNTTLEVVLFNLMSVSLSKTKNKSLMFIEIGFIFLIAFNLAHRFSYLNGHYYKSFDMVWLMCYLIIVYGFSLTIKANDEPIYFFEKNSIHVLISAIFTMFAIFLFTLFLSFGFIISSIEINNIGSLIIFPESIPSVLVFSFSFAVLIGKLVANHFSRPLEKISKRIDIMNELKLKKNEIPDEKFKIYEIDKLDNFIMNSICELHAANSVKTEFLMNMSHDFRTPASGIYHMSRLIHKKIDDPEIKKLQQLIVDSSAQLMNLLEDILDYSRLENDKYKINIQKTNIQSIINEVVLFLSAKASEKMLRIDCNHHIPEVNYYGDRLIIHRIILNIVSNAIKFTHAGGVTISTNMVESADNKWILIMIKDTGIGIDESHHKLIFEPFSRVESAETAKYSGIGLGLSNVFLMLKKIGGKITLESSVNNGSTFSVYLPI